MMEEEDKIVQKTSRIRLIKDKMAGSMMLTFTLVSVLLVVLIGIGLVLKSLPILHDKSLWELLSGGGQLEVTIEEKVMVLNPVT